LLEPASVVDCAFGVRGEPLLDSEAMATTAITTAPKTEPDAMIRRRLRVTPPLRPGPEGPPVAPPGRCCRGGTLPPERAGGAAGRSLGREPSSAPEAGRSAGPGGTAGADAAEGARADGGADAGPAVGAGGTGPNRLLRALRCGGAETWPTAASTSATETAGGSCEPTGAGDTGACAAAPPAREPAAGTAATPRPGAEDWTWA
jgi:hypothetical protein